MQGADIGKFITFDFEEVEIGWRKTYSVTVWILEPPYIDGTIPMLVHYTFDGTFPVTVGMDIVKKFLSGVRQSIVRRLYSTFDFTNLIGEKMESYIDDVVNKVNREWVSKDFPFIVKKEKVATWYSGGGSSVVTHVLPHNREINGALYYRAHYTTDFKLQLQLKESETKSPSQLLRTLSTIYNLSKDDYIELVKDISVTTRESIDQIQKEIDDEIKEKTRPYMEDYIARGKEVGLTEGTYSVDFSIYTYGILVRLEKWEFRQPHKFELPYKIWKNVKENYERGGIVDALNSLYAYFSIVRDHYGIEALSEVVREVNEVYQNPIPREEEK